MQHRNSQKRDFMDNNVYFIVTKTFQNFPYFKELIFCELLVEELKLCKEVKKFKLYGFCIIYDHLNLMIHPNNEFNISEIMKSLKENISRDINYIIMNSHNEGDTSTCRLRMQDLIKNYQTKFIQKHGQNQTLIPKFKWQKSFYDHIIRDAKDFKNHHHYTIYNFQKHKLPENWKYTSLNYEELVNGIEL